MDLTVPAVALTKQLAEVMRWREMEWDRIPALTRKLTMLYLTATDTINLDTAVSDKEERKHLVKAYKGLRSRGLDGYAHYRVNVGGKDAGLIWVQKRSIDLRNFRLEYRGYKGEKDQGKVLTLLVIDQNQELATYFATRCDVRDCAYFGGSSTLIWASGRGYLEIVEALLGREGTDVNRSDSYGDTALHCAAREGNIEVARSLLQAGANARKSNDYGRTPLHYASEKGCIEIVRALLEAGAGADVRNYDTADDINHSPISRACKGKHFEVFRALVEAGGDVNKLDSRGYTALHHASVWVLTEGVRYVCVERGADVNKSATDEFGDTPLTMASEFGKVETIRVMLEAGADVNKSATGGDGHTPLTLASEFGKVEVARVLLEAGADVNKRATGGDGHTPLILASGYGRVEVARVLLEAGADVNKRDGDGRTPLLIALQVYASDSEQRKQDMAKVAALLREAGAQEPQPHEFEESDEEFEEPED